MKKASVEFTLKEIADRETAIDEEAQAIPSLKTLCQINKFFFATKTTPEQGSFSENLTKNNKVGLDVESFLSTHQILN